MSQTYHSYWRCPSNIAIVKYWGKKPEQIPMNASLSLTLSQSNTEVRATLSPKSTSESVALSYFFEGNRNELFEAKFSKYLEAHSASFPFLKDFQLEIHSKNSFPHSTGIASSASAFGGLALVLCDLFEQTQGQKISGNWLQTASHFARLGSGSACRSVFPNWAQWGKTDGQPESSDLFALPINKVHTNFMDMRDTILVVDDQPKKVSSTAGHALMNKHPYALSRFQQANSRVDELTHILQSGDLDAFVQLTESEALTLHAMMMTSSDYYLLMRPNTILVIEKIFEFREQSGIPICFTLDAGPNIHLLYPAQYEVGVKKFINEVLSNCAKSIIFDRGGNGPEQIISD